MTEIHAGPEALERRGSRIRGILGAFLGAFLGAYLSDLLLFFLFESETGRLGFLGAMLLVGWSACWGYRLLGGYRSMGFAQWTVRLGLILGQPSALAAALIRRETRRLCAADMTMDPAALRKICLETGALLLERDALAAIGMLVLLSLFFVRLSWGGLLKYVDPGWYHDPRRLARIGGGGVTSNMPPCWPLPPAGRIPTQFEVDKGRLRVEGSVLTYKTWGKPPRSFSINDVAGVVLGVSTGYNILYDRENRMLARFAWSRKNTLLFGQYLIRRGILFVDLNGAPVSTLTVEQPLVPQQFTVREGKLCLVLGWIGTVLLGVAALILLLLLEGWERLGYTLLALPLLALFGSLLLCYYNRRLEVDGELVTYTTLLRRTFRFRLSDVAEIKLGVNSCKLKDQEGRILARFEDNMENADLLLARWNEYKQERTDNYE